MTQEFPARFYLQHLDQVNLAHADGTKARLTPEIVEEIIAENRHAAGRGRQSRKRRPKAAP